MVRVQTPQITVPIGPPPARADVAGGLAEIGRVLGAMQARDRRASNRQTLFAMQTEWLEMIDKLEVDVHDVDPDQRQPVYSKGLEPMAQRIAKIQEPELQEELSLRFGRDAMRGGVRVRQNARKARGEQINAASIQFEDQLIVELGKGADIDDVVARQAADIDAMVGEQMSTDTAELRKRAFEGRAVQERFSDILDSDLPADVKADAGRVLLESELAVSALPPDERTRKSQKLDGLVPREINILRQQSTAAGQTTNLLMLDEIETQLLDMPDSPLKTLALTEVAADRARAVSAFDAAGRLLEFFAADTPAPKGEPYSRATRNEAYRLLQDDASASLEEIGAWFAKSPGVDFPPDYARDVQNLFDGGSGDFDLVKGISVYQAIKAIDENAANRLIADSNIKDVSQTVVRMTEMLPDETDRIIDVMSRGEANADAQAMAKLITDKDTPIERDADISNAFDAAFGRTPDILVHDGAGRDWKAAAIYRYVEATQVLGDAREPSAIGRDASKRAANDLKQRFSVIEESDLLPSTYDAILVPKWVDVTERLEGALEGMSLTFNPIFGFPTAVLNGELVTNDPDAGVQLFPVVGDGQIQGVLVWDPTQQTGTVVLPTDSTFGGFRDQILDRSVPAQRDAYHWMTWNDTYASAYILQHDQTSGSNLTTRLFTQARDELMVLGALPDDVAEQKNLILLRAEAIAQAKGWKGIASETP